ncbi:uncharacterized protein LOC100891087 isoform X1 [Strongylocentrotus purpuratus]|uniref:Uncharacterized protein n=1 Tax=Strongylocentrotus purpuratus TaxID=7668 RepID=A0A7M7NNH6_STRPU|nr:uncharacterized protein LOC100891087 isoform X1 [Strongylocentrotus purpuratus]
MCKEKSSTGERNDGKPCQGPDVLPYEHPGNRPVDTHQEYVYAHADLLDASTDHILVPVPSFESLPTSNADLDDSKSPSVPWANLHSKGRVRSGPKPRGGCMKQKTFKPITNVRVSFCGSTLEKNNGLQKEQKRALKEKQIPCTDDGTNDRAQDVNVGDMSKNFSGKHHNYHGYHLVGTPITTEGAASKTVDCVKTAESGKDKMKEVRLCVAHREFLQDGQRSSGGRPAATPYSTPRTRDTDNELVLTTKLYPPTLESDEHTTQSDDASTPMPSKAIAGRFNSTSKKKKKEPCRVYSASTTSSITVPSPRSLLHPSIASIHCKKENTPIVSNFAILRCSDNKGGTFAKLLKNGVPVKRNGQNKKKGEKERKNAVCKSPESPVCRRTTVELTDREVRGQKFKMYDEMPQRALQKRPIRRSPEHSSRQSANIQNRGYRSARVNAPNFQADDAPSKFIQKFGANRLSQNNKDGHQHCRMPTYGYAKNNFLGHPPSHSRIQSADTASRKTSPLRRVVDISEQAMNSLVNEAIREKKTNQHVSGGDIVKSLQRHFSDLRKSQKRSPGYEMYTRFIPVQTSEKTGNEIGMLRPSSSPVPRLNVPKEPVFNIKETLPVPPHPYLTPPPPSSASAPPPVDKAESPRGAGRAVMATGITKRNAVSATDASGATLGQVEEWDATYRLERKVSATVKGAAYVRNMRNDQRTRAWVADLASDFAPNNVSEQ